MTKEELSAQRRNNLAKARATAASNRAARAAADAEWHRKRKALPAAPPDHAAASKSDVPHEFVGITRTDCPAACTFERCVISGRPVCAHPNKGGLQSQHMLDQAAVERHGRAKKHLEHVKVDSRQ